ncbi:unnamed protein product [Cercospora beticola]|nr:unnamed protein product [Cercospora beticola]
MYSQLSRTERRNYYGYPHDPVYARRLREQRDVYFSRRVGSDYPPLDPSQRRESYETRSGDDYPQQSQYRYHEVADRDSMRSDPRGYEAAEGYERYISRSRRSRSPTRGEGSGYSSQHSTYDYAHPTLGYDGSSRRYDPRPESGTWSSVYAEPRDGYHRGSYDYTGSSRYELTAPAYRGSNTGYPGDRSSTAYSFDARNPSSRLSSSMSSTRTRTPMNEYQRYQYGADAVQRWNEDRYFEDGYGRR